MLFPKHSHISSRLPRFVISVRSPGSACDLNKRILTEAAGRPEKKTNPKGRPIRKMRVKWTSKKPKSRWKSMAGNFRRSPKSATQKTMLKFETLTDKIVPSSWHWWSRNAQMTMKILLYECKISWDWYYIRVVLQSFILMMISNITSIISIITILELISLD